MAVVRGVVIVLLMVLLMVLGSRAAPVEDCDRLLQPLQSTQVEKISGEWVLVGALTNFAAWAVVVTELISSKVEMRLNPDNTTVLYREWNQLRNDSCIFYNMNAALSNSSNLTLHVNNGFVQINGVRSIYVESARVHQYQACDDCLLMAYHASTPDHTPKDFILSYRRLGKHQDPENLKGVAQSIRRLGACLQMDVKGQFTYDGVSGFCSSNDPAPVEAEQD